MNFDLDGLFGAILGFFGNLFSGLFEPVVLDLDGNGVDVTQLDQSMAYFDLNGLGRQHTAWAGPHDGILAIDLGRDGSFGPDGIVDQAREIVFTHWAPGTTSDMAALRQVFDTNHDGSLDPGDSHWSDFRIWQDRDGNGVSQPSELSTLDQLGIASVGLNPCGPAVRFGDGSAVQGSSTFTRNDGSTGSAGDVAFASSPNPSASSAPSYAAPVDAWPMPAHDPGGWPVPEPSKIPDYLFH